MLRLFSCILFLGIISSVGAQKQDYIWLYGSEIYDIILPDRAADTTKGASDIDFNFEPPKIYYNPERFLDFTFVNSSICNSNGKILAYTNGQVIYNQFDQPIADTINYGSDWEYNNYGDDEMAIPGGLVTIQGAIVLPVPGHFDQYYTFYTTQQWETTPYSINKISFALFDVSDENMAGHLLIKDIMMLEDTLSGSITAIRHGNGRDWWLIAPRMRGHKLNIWLIDPSGVHYHGVLDTGLPGNKGIGQISGSPDGKWLAWFIGDKFIPTGGQLFITQFDRCSGTINNPDFSYVDLSNYRFSLGVAFSYDSRFLYMCNRDYIYQYDLNAMNVLDSERKVATYDGYEYFFPWDTLQPLGRQVDFFSMGLAPDGRIYISPGSATTRMMSVMHFPEKADIACDVRQHSLLMPTGFFRCTPNFPAYRLGSSNGSPCDTLGIDNLPVAKFRYEVDKSDYRSLYFTDLSYYRPASWSWDFGDGSLPVKEQYPVHKFQKDGSYEVCLEVRNENGSNATCRTLTIGTTGIEELHSSSPMEVSIYPNPVSDYLQITIGEYIPQDGSVIFYDITGNTIHSQRVFHGHNLINLSKILPGSYTCIFKDNGLAMKTFKIIKL